MSDWFQSLPTAEAGVVMVGGFVLVALIVGYLVSRFTSREVRTAHNDRAGFIIAVIGVIYAVLLAFVAVGVWERFEQADARTYEEAASVATIYRDSQSFPRTQTLRAMLRAYVQSIVVHEWPQMHRGERSQVSNALLERIDARVRELTPGTLGLANVQAQMLAAADTAIADREARLTIDSGGINEIMWTVLLVGAVVTVAFTYLFGFDRTLMQLLMVGGLSFLIGLVLFLVGSLDYPFRGSIAVEPDAFRAVLETFNGIAR